MNIVIRRYAGLVSALLVLTSVVPSTASAQTFRGSTASTMGGIAVGAYSGAAYGLIGSLLPCNRTRNGGRCAAAGASVGGAVGLAMGGLIGAQNQDALIARVQNAGVGALVGAAMGLGLRSAVRQYGWADVATMTALGGAVGIAPMGSAIGAGVGATTGAIVWLAFPRAGLADFVLLTLAGSAIGGVIDLAHGAATAKRDASRGFGSSFSITIR